MRLPRDLSGDELVTILDEVARHFSLPCEEVLRRLFGG
jgi:hypothetical protein